MRCVYELTIAANCPEGGRDQYEVIIVSDQLIEVETIIGIIDDHTQEPIYQEDLTARIAEALDQVRGRKLVLPTGNVTLVGTHSGVKTTTHEEFGDEPG